MASWSNGVDEESITRVLPRFVGEVLQRDEFGEAGDAARRRSAFFCSIRLTFPHFPAKEITRLDHMDIGARQENLAVRGEPIMLQLCVVPAYALTIHKVSVCSYA